MSMTLSSSKESTNSPWCELAIEIHKISSLATPIQTLMEKKDLGDSVYDTFEQFWQKANIMKFDGCS